MAAVHILYCHLIREFFPRKFLIAFDSIALRISAGLFLFLSIQEKLFGTDVTTTTLEHLYEFRHCALSLCLLELEDSNCCIGNNACEFCK